MSITAEAPEQRLVKSAERVRDLGEVFTPSQTVKEMLDLLPTSIWKPHPSATFLEPSCGDGNFIVAILDRKLRQIGKFYEKGRLPAGESAEAAQFHALEALSSIYAVDISKDNVIGGTPGHEIGARTRLLDVFSTWSLVELGKRLTERSLVWRSASWIVEHNVIIGNMLPFDAEGRPAGRDALPIIEYSWSPDDSSVSISKTTLGDIIALEESKTTLPPTLPNVLPAPSLFDPSEPEFLWKGKATAIHEGERTLAPKLKGPARNGLGGIQR